MLEATAPHPSGILTAHELAGYLPEIVDAYRRVGAAVQPHGTRLFVQLFHGGREQIAGPPRAPALAPSAIPSQRFRVAPRALRAHEIEEIVAGFAASAELAAEGGLDGVEISAAHRYLVAQFFDPELNLRDDEWGEPSRFLLEVVRAVRAAAPALAVGVRLSADSLPAAARGAAPRRRGRLPQPGARRVVVVPRLDADRAAAAARREPDRGPPRPVPGRAAADRDVARRRSGRGGPASSPRAPPTRSA